MSRPEFVYIAHGDGAAPAWKIGCTYNVVDRLGGLARFEPLTLVALFPGDHREEYRLHNRFAHLRATGRGREWYRDDGTLAAFVASLPPHRRGSVRFVFDPSPRAPRQPAPVDEHGRRRYDLVHARYKANAIAAHDHPLSVPSPATCARCAEVAAWRKRRAALYDALMAQPYFKAEESLYTRRLARVAEHHTNILGRTEPRRAA